MDLSLCVYSCGNALLYFLVYVNDLIITGSNPHLVNNIILLKGLGVLSFFCGVEVLATSMGLLLSQQKYVIDLLSKYNMLDSKPDFTQLVVGTSLTTKDGTVPVKATM